MVVFGVEALVQFRRECLGVQVIFKVMNGFKIKRINAEMDEPTVPNKAVNIVRKIGHGEDEAPPQYQSHF